jgi:hypothetical protein
LPSETASNAAFLKFPPRCSAKIRTGLPMIHSIKSASLFKIKQAS